MIYTIFENYKIDLDDYKIIHDYGYDDRRSDYREVLEVEKKIDSVKYVIKIGRANWKPEGSNLTFEQETKLSYKMAKNNVGPIVEIFEKSAKNIYTGETLNVICMVMPKWDISYQDYKVPSDVKLHSNINVKLQSEISKKIYDLIYSKKGLVNSFYIETKLIHGDLHPGNILFNLDERGVPIEAVLIDFECTYPNNSEVLDEIYPEHYKLKHIYTTIEQYEMARLHSTCIYNTVIPYVVNQI